MDTFYVLKEKSGNERSILFFEHITEFKKLLFVRNHSRLAHGQKPITKETFEKIIGFIENVFQLKDEIMFPALK